MSAPPQVPRRTITQFCDHVCQYVRFHPDHEAIRAELAAHMEDHAAALMERGVPEEEATKQAVAAMGDPEEIGRELDKSHSPLLGWLHICFGWFTGIAIYFSVVIVVWSLWGSSPPESFRAREAAWADRIYSSYSTVLLDTRPEAVFHGRDYTFSVQRAILTEYYGCIDLDYLVRADWFNPWLPTPNLTHFLRAEDDLGNVYVNGYDTWDHGDRYCGGGLTADTPRSAFYSLWVTGIPPEAESLTLVLDRFGTTELSLTIPLREEASHG